jgi:drug/metabolite transporter (DMT)-like permease
MKERRLSGIAAAIGSNLIFGFSFLFSRTALTRGVPVATLLGLRFLVAFLAMTLLVLVGVLRVDFRGKRLVRLLPLVLIQPVLYFVCESFGIRMTSSSEAGIIIALLPIVSLILAALFLRERQTGGRVAFVLLSIAGAVLIVLGSGSAPSFSLLGTVLLFGAVLSAAVFNLLSRHLSETFTGVEMTYAMMATGTLVFGVAAVVETAADSGLPALAVQLSDPVILLSLGYLGLLSSVAAFILLHRAVEGLGAARTASFANLATVVSIAAGTLVLHESLAWYHFVGSGLILVGVWGANRGGSSARKAAADASATGAASGEDGR